jgi:hypothetical protein
LNLAAAQELYRRKQIEAGISELRERSIASLSDKQRAFVEDKSLSQTLITSRQSGKTTCLEKKLCIAAQSIEQADLIYVATTRDAARDPFWERLKQYAIDNKIPAVPNETMLEMRFDAFRSKISLRGVPDLKRANRLRGPTRNGAVIDESQNYPDDVLKTLVIDVLEPSLMAKQGWLVLAGTPGLQPKGAFYDASINPEYSHHRWGLESNPIYAGRVEDIVQKVLRKNGWTRSEPAFRREYLGEWCADANSGVYRVSSANLYGELPAGAWHHVLGVDLGYNDEAAFSVLAWRDDDPILRIVYADGDSELTVSDIAERIKQLRNEYSPHHIVCDAGALGKTIVEEFRQRHGLHVEAADKKDKPSAIRLINSDFVKGQLLLPNGRLYEQMSALRWHPEHIGLKEQDGMPNDLCDATLYAFRKCFHYLEEIRKPRPKVGTDEHLRVVAQEHRDRVKEQLEIERHSGGGWEKDIFGVDSDVFES